MNKISKEEQETTINMFPTGISNKAEIFTCIPAMMTKLFKLAEDHPRDVSIRENDGCLFCTVPVSWVRISPRRKCNLSDEQRKANGERLKAYMEARKT